MNKTLKLLFSILLPLLAGGLSGFLTAGSVNGWYMTLNKPEFNPPNWVFGPVWTTLYLVMGISLYRIWRLPSDTQRNVAILIFLLQMTLNFFWSLIFFGWQEMGIALIEIIMLWISIAFMIRHFYQLDRAAGYMNIPYILWVSFATMLNAAYFLLN